ncbi:hypothetical protein [Thermoactinomyces mirandus]|uniref:Uncharacterized protein n=1 Tax=Thermoactinomyces mirandus TaxID=2756294 RepID=A0A7W2ATP9_9BACL|nr:hypothetical protein [Thermoactinomyces mirandus]MBA4603771.1 hypothetical protein [Thermoactinomyces mirandus]
MDAFTRFVRENVDRPQSVKAERVLVLPKELEKEFEYYCRKRNLSFNEAVVMLLEKAVQDGRKNTSHRE